MSPGTGNRWWLQCNSPPYTHRNPFTPFVKKVHSLSLRATCMSKTAIGAMHSQKNRHPPSQQPTESVIQWKDTGNLIVSDVISMYLPWVKNLEHSVKMCHKVTFSLSCTTMSTFCNCVRICCTTFGLNANIARTAKTELWPEKQIYSTYCG